MHIWIFVKSQWLALSRLLMPSAWLQVTVSCGHCSPTSLSCPQKRHTRFSVINFAKTKDQSSNEIADSDQIPKGPTSTCSWGGPLSLGNPGRSGHRKGMLHVWVPPCWPESASAKEATYFCLLLFWNSGMLTGIFLITKQYSLKLQKIIKKKMEPLFLWWSLWPNECTGHLSSPHAPAPPLSNTSRETFLK